ncbi:hypothetical protein ACLOJK_001285 [Asimina triloba]
MATYRLAVIIQSPSESDDSTLLLRQIPPPKLPDAEYSNYVDSDLWDLPSAPLNLLPQGHQSSLLIDGADKSARRIDLGAFDIGSAVDQVLSQIGVGRSVVEEWVFWKYVEEAEFGPEPLVHSVFIYGKLKSDEISLQDCVPVLDVFSVTSCRIFDNGFRSGMVDMGVGCHGQTSCERPWESALEMGISKGDPVLSVTVVNQDTDVMEAATDGPLIKWCDLDPPWTTLMAIVKGGLRFYPDCAEKGEIDERWVVAPMGDDIVGF